MPLETITKISWAYEIAVARLYDSMGSTRQRSVMHGSKLSRPTIFFRTPAVRRFAESATSTSTRSESSMSGADRRCSVHSAAVRVRELPLLGPCASPMLIRWSPSDGLPLRALSCRPTTLAHGVRDARSCGRAASDNAFRGCRVGSETGASDSNPGCCSGLEPSGLELVFTRQITRYECRWASREALSGGCQARSRHQEPPALIQKNHL